MVQVRFTRHLSRYFPDLAEREEVAANTVAEVVPSNAELKRRLSWLGFQIRTD